MNVQIEPTWKEQLASEFEKPYFGQLTTAVRQEYQQTTCYPPGRLIFNAFNLCPFDQVKVVIIGQDPYHEPGQAHGLSFSVQPGVAPPPSLLNIFKELASDLGCRVPNNGCLKPWADQGVLLLNTVLTVREHQANSHHGRGWEIFTDKIISLLNEREKPMAFILWGSPARKKKAMITNPRHFIVESTHPSPFSANNGFFGSRPFSKVNAFLEKIGEKPIDWQLPDL